MFPEAMLPVAMLQAGWSPSNKSISAGSLALRWFLVMATSCFRPQQAAYQRVLGRKATGLLAK
jgi:hypothetical protein